MSAAKQIGWGIKYHDGKRWRLYYGTYSSRVRAVLNHVIDVYGPLDQDRYNNRLNPLHKKQWAAERAKGIRAAKVVIEELK